VPETDGKAQIWSELTSHPGQRFNQRFTGTYPLDMLEAHGTRGSKESLAQAALSGPEREVVSRLVGRLEDELADDLRAIWLYGSRARGEASVEEADPDLKSDIDLMVIADGGRQRYDAKVHDLAYKTAVDGGESPVWYSVFVFDPEWLRGRREIKSFFIQNVDRDKLVLAGSALE
jgi:predicted nucleotidyltransferase